MIEAKVIDALSARHPQLHPLLFQRSVEYAESAGELFDILESVPPVPVCWDKNKRRWISVENIFSEPVLAPFKKEEKDEYDDDEDEEYDDYEDEDDEDY